MKIPELFKDSEIWKVIPGFPDYKINNKGELFSSRSGKWRPIKSRIRKHGYKEAGLYGKGKRRYRLVHRLVLEAFVGICPEGMECCHNNGIRTDNCLENLRWGTKADNTRDRIRHGNQVNGNRHGMSKLTEDDAVFVKRMIRIGFGNMELSEFLGVNHSTIGYIRSGRNWRHVA